MAPSPKTPSVLPCNSEPAIAFAGFCRTHFLSGELWIERADEIHPNNVARCEEHPRGNKLFDGVGVGAEVLKTTMPCTGTVIDRDVIYPSASARDGTHGFGDITRAKFGLEQNRSARTYHC